MAKELRPKEGYARYAAFYDKSAKYWDSFEKHNLDRLIEGANGKRYWMRGRALAVWPSASTTPGPR